MTAIVIGYDGSPDARQAIDAAGALHAEVAVVVTVWQPPLAAGTAALPLGAPAVPAPEEEEQLEAAARRIADEGCARAQEAGMATEAVTLPGAGPAEIGRILATLADDRDAAAIVVGRRGVSRLHAVVLGSVSESVVREARRPVFVVPAEEE